MIAKLEQFVRRLVQDQAFREMATCDAEQAIAAYGLQGPERQGALKLCTQLAGSGARDTGSLGFWI